MTRIFKLALPLAISLVAWNGTALAQTTNFPQLISGDGTEEICNLTAATRCISHIWNVIDADSDQLLSVTEVEQFAAHVRKWNVSTDRNLTDRTTARIALLTFNLVGAQRIVASYDKDDDGMLSMAEATADLVGLEADKRPIASLLLDGNAVNRDALAERFGIIGSQLISMAQTVGSSMVGGDINLPDAATEAAKGTDQVSKVD